MTDQPLATWVVSPRGDNQDFVRILTRPGTDDYKVVEEIWSGDAYHLRGLGAPTPRPLVIDAGAHIGCFSLLVGKLWPTARIFAYEPNAENRVLWCRNVEPIADRATLSANAIGAEANLATLVGSGATGRLIYGPTDSGISVPVVGLADTITELADRYNSPVGMLKLDIEGSEYEALLACKPDVLRRVEHLVMEWHGRDQHPWVTPGRYGELLEHLAETHSVSAFGPPAGGGMLYAHRS